MAEVDTSSGSPARVALDLAKIIAYAEQPAGSAEKQTREYWIELYARCRQVVVNGNPNKV